MAKGAEAFRSIGEVAKMIGVAPHVLRYWETQFSLLKPMKRGDGRRYYRPDDVRLAAGICEILRDEGLTIRGAKKMLSKDRGESVRARGAIKLGEAVETVAADSGAVDGDGRASIESVTETAAMTPKPVAPPPDAASLSELDQPDRAPRSRNRKRPVPTRVPDPLPLFPEDRPDTGLAADPAASAARQPVAVDPVQAAWLGRLIGVTAALQASQGGADLSDPARDVARQLLDAIADHY
ncbi:MerR family transcriptional regulator [Paracoccus sp. M683]|uniref:MerR family transcriptional regulator n=1 Tax=Paracoccus sp. M683 TaxID=2594268 RepID=UPI00118048BE|nr:MerR family transcriptional regulator [Paracoccus sp. M683]TRW96701.1 MerR family transcriptional regulator [Paracoccus sp. M683]